MFHHTILQNGNNLIYLKKYINFTKTIHYIKKFKMALNCH